MSSSVRESVGAAVKAAVEALGFTFNTGIPVVATAVPVVQRKIPALPAGKDPAAICVSVGEEGETERIDATRDLVKYPVAVTIVTAGGTQLLTDATIDSWRQQIRRALQTRASYTSVTGWNAVTSQGKSPYDPTALAKDLNVSTVSVTVEVLEPRT